MNRNRAGGRARALVREEERLGLRLVLVAVRGGELAHHPPDGKVVEVPLVPVVIVNRKAELSRALLVQLHGADLGVVGHRLAEAQLEAARDEVVPLQHLAEPVVPVLQLLDWKAAAKRERVERVRLLRVVVRPHLVDLQMGGLARLVKVGILIRPS